MKLTSFNLHHLYNSPSKMHSSKSSTSTSSSFPSVVLLALFLFSWSWVQASAEWAGTAGEGGVAAGGRAASQWEEEQNNFLRAVRANMEEKEALTEIAVPAQVISKRSVAVRLCGKQLVNTIRVACIHLANRGKRSAADMRPFYMSVYRPNFEDSSLEGTTQGEAEALANAMSYHRPTGLSDKFDLVNQLQRMHKRGAADSCCARPCTMAHLETYC